MLTIHPEWDNRDLSAEIARLRREDPAYDKAWKDGLQRMADEWDQRCVREFEIALAQRTGDEPV